MKKDKIKVYIYTRVSTTIQVDGYSLDAQKARMKAFAEYNDYERAKAILDRIPPEIIRAYIHRDSKTQEVRHYR